MRGNVRGGGRGGRGRGRAGGGGGRAWGQLVCMTHKEILRSLRGRDRAAVAYRPANQSESKKHRPAQAGKETYLERRS